MTLDIFRDNLHLSSTRFHNEDEKLAALCKFVGETEGSGIVYVNSRHKCETLAYELRRINVAAEAYHAGLANRGAVQDRFMGDRTRVVVATVAFGMGIDKSDIRFIVHFHPPRSLAAYYQEVGRAGRDGLPSQGLLFYSNNDWADLRRWAKADEFTIDYLLKVYVAIANQLNVKIAPEQLEDKDRGAPDSPLEGIGPVDARRLQQVLNSDETTVRVAISMLERADLLSRGFDIPREVEIGMVRSLPPEAATDQDFNFLKKGLDLKPGRRAAFQLQDVADFLDRPLDNVDSLLMAWQNQGFLTVKGSRRAMFIELSSTPPDVHERLARLLAQSAALAQRRIDDVIGYATAESCRHGYISMHFGSPVRSSCDVCDNCTGLRPELPEIKAPEHPLPDDADIEPMIIDCLVSLPKPVGRSGLARILAGGLRSPVKPHQARHYGRLKELGEAATISYIDDLLEKNALRQYERSGYPVLAATIRGRSEAESWLDEHPELAAYPEENKVPAQEEVSQENEGDKYTALQKALWVWRRRTSDELNQPPYVIMSNDLMLQIAETRPQTEAELSALPGMGVQRLQRYGPMILDLIQLNPVQAGDDELMHRQRTDQASGEQRIRTGQQLSAPAVSPQVERRIFLKLQEIRQKRAIAEGIPPYQAASNTILKTIARNAPRNRDELESIVGFRSARINADTEQILTFVTDAIEPQ